MHLLFVDENKGRWDIHVGRDDPARRMQAVSDRSKPAFFGVFSAFFAAVALSETVGTAFFGAILWVFGRFQTASGREVTAKTRKKHGIFTKKTQK